MKYIKLNNKVKMPILGYGVYKIDKEMCEQSVLDAINAGYRSIDTAQSYGNEEEVGSAIVKCGIPRKEFFITTKIWIDNFGYEKTMKSFALSLKRLQLEYIDLVLVHQPFGDYYGCYKALEELYKQGKIKAIGVSNFYPDRLADLCAFNTIKPQINQVEVNPLHQQIFAEKYMKENDVQMEAWAPFGEGKNNMFNNEILKKIADKHNKSVAQVIIRWLIQRNIVVLAKTVTKSRMIENINVFDFALSDDEMKQILQLDTKKSLFFEHDDPKTVGIMMDTILRKRKEKMF